MSNQTHLRVSIPASQAFAKVKRLLADHPAFPHDVTASIVVEFLCAHFLDEVTMLKFRPQTVRGRPRGRFYEDNARPSNVRKAAGLTKTEAALGPKRDGR